MVWEPLDSRYDEAVASGATGWGVVSVYLRFTVVSGSMGERACERVLGMLWHGMKKSLGL